MVLELYSRKGVLRLLDAQNWDPPKVVESRVWARRVPEAARAGNVVLGIACAPLPKIFPILPRIVPLRDMGLVVAGIVVVAIMPFVICWVGVSAAAVVAGFVVMAVVVVVAAEVVRA
jgi:hypothetical protein